MFGYVTDLRSMTQGRAVPDMQMHSYEKVPDAIQKQIIEERGGTFKGLDEDEE